jgi:hypothetical protein
VTGLPEHPDVADVTRVGTYPALVCSGGGFVWDSVLEYRVWCHPADGGDDFYHAFAHVSEALRWAAEADGADEVLALVLQEEYLNEVAPGVYLHVTTPRLTEWPLEFLRRPRRTATTISDFLAPDAPSNRLSILRGLDRA